MPFRPRIAKLVRVTDLDGRTLHFMIPGTDRRHVAEMVARDRVPEFEGETAWFEMVLERVPGCPWPRWRVIRRVEDRD